MVERAPICFFNCGTLTPEEARYKFALYIDGFPSEEFKYIEFDDIIPHRYFITSYGRVFTIDGREIFPMYDYAHNDKTQMVYMRIELSCKNKHRRKFYIHRLVANAFITKTQEDIALGRDCVNHKFNKDGRCNYVWNLEWCTNEENTNHYYHYNESYDPHLFNFRYITDRNDYLLQTRVSVNRSTRLSEYQVMLICEAYTIKGYCPEDCAIYAWIEPTPGMMKIINSILSGTSWCYISSKYGIIPHPHK